MERRMVNAPMEQSTLNHNLSAMCLKGFVFGGFL